jgi:hypothetical protein
MADYVNLNTLTNLDLGYLNALPSGTITDYQGINHINSGLNSVKTALANDTTPFILSKQTDMKKIVDDETTRLNAKETSVNEVVSSKKRMIDLNDNYIQRTREYTKMVIAIVIGLAIWLFLVVLNNFSPIPDGIFTITLILLFSFISIYCLQIYFKILSRDRLDFNKIEVAPPKKLSPEELEKQTAENKKNGNLFGGLDGGCIGSLCCDDGTKWDSTTQTCKLPTAQLNPTSTGTPISGFTTMSSIKSDKYSLY